MPPIEPPTTQNNVSIPRRSISIVCARTMSGIVMTGKSSPHNLPGAGLVEAGPVEPMHPPMPFEQMMKYPWVSGGGLPIGLVGGLERGELDAAIELQRLVQAEHRDLRTRMIGLVRAFLRVG